MSKHNKSHGRQSAKKPERKMNRVQTQFLNMLSGLSADSVEDIEVVKAALGKVERWLPIPREMVKGESDAFRQLAGMYNAERNKLIDLRKTSTGGNPVLSHALKAAGADKVNYPKFDESLHNGVQAEGKSA